MDDVRRLFGSTRARAVAALVATLAALALVIGLAAVDGDPTATVAADRPTRIPDGVPLRLQEPLRELHAAVDQADLARLDSLLAQVDAALVTDRSAIARQDLDSLVEAATAAQNDGRLASDDAERVLAAAAQLLAMLLEEPEPSPTPTPTQTTQTGGGGTGGGGTGGGGGGGSDGGKGHKGKGKGKHKH